MPLPRLLQVLPRPLRDPRVLGAARLFLIGLLLGWVYGWAGPQLYPAGTRFGFFRGMAHGACMPMALPALLMGKDVSIYSENNTGRGYKLGYIAGINVCGLIFFGGAFWKPKRKDQGQTAKDEGSPKAESRSPPT